MDLADVAVLAAQWLVEGTPEIEITVELLGMEPQMNDEYLASLRVFISDSEGKLIGGSLEITGPIEGDVLPLTPDFCENLPGDSPCELQASSLVFLMAYLLHGEVESWNLTFTITNSLGHTVSKTIVIPKETTLADMVLIPGGTFQMGDHFNEGGSDEVPVHSVTLDSFRVAKYPVTNDQYCEFLNSALEQGLIIVSSGVVYKSFAWTQYPYCDTSASSPYSQITYDDGVFSVRTKAGRNMNDDPMVMVSWYGAVAYCNWRSLQEGREPCYNLETWECDFSKNGYHLPTEAQWEYAARGGLSGKRFPWGDTITHAHANYQADSFAYMYDISPTQGYHPAWKDGIMPYTSPVGSFAPNGYGLYDMAGNVWEWCNDWYSISYYSTSPETDPTGPTLGTDRVLRGGCWNNIAGGCRVANRYYRGPGGRNYSVYGYGFRVSLDFWAK